MTAKPIAAIEVDPNRGAKIGRNGKCVRKGTSTETAIEGDEDVIPGDGGEEGANGGHGEEEELG